MSPATLPAPASSLVLYLNPYDGSPGAYVHDTDELRAVLDRFAARGTEEWEVDVIDGEHGRLMECAARCMSADELFKLDGMLDHGNAPSVFYLLSVQGMRPASVDWLLDCADDVSLFEGSAEDYADSIVDELYNVPPALRSYIDCEALGRDLELGGDIATFEYEGCCYVVTNPND
jgi:hypothetical protein